MSINDKNNLPDYWAINIDYATEDLRTALQYTIFLSEILDTPVHFVIEQKKKNNHYHMHGYISNEHKYTESKLAKLICQWFRGKNWKIKPVFYLEGWKDYMLKESDRIRCVYGKNVIY